LPRTLGRSASSSSMRRASRRSSTLAPASDVHKPPPRAARPPVKGCPLPAAPRGRAKREGTPRTTFAWIEKKARGVTLPSLHERVREPRHDPTVHKPPGGAAEWCASGIPTSLASSTTDTPLGLRAGVPGPGRCLSPSPPATVLGAALRQLPQDPCCRHHLACLRAPQHPPAGSPAHPTTPQHSTAQGHQHHSQSQATNLTRKSPPATP